MIINHPYLGPRDAIEFVYKGDASLLLRPEWDKKTSASDFHEYLYLRTNPAGIHNELWYHEHGDRSWIVVTRNTVTHDILQVSLVSDFLNRNKND